MSLLKTSSLFWCCFQYGLPFNSLATVGYLLEVFIKLWIASMVRIFTSPWRTWKPESRLY